MEGQWIQWPQEIGQEDKEWYTKQLHSKLKVEQHESHQTRGDGDRGC